MILGTADDIKLGNSEVDRVYSGSDLVWPLPLGFWAFNESDGSTISKFSVTTSSGNILIDWGDGTQNTINSGGTVNKTY